MKIGSARWVCLFVAFIAFFAPPGITTADESARTDALILAVHPYRAAEDLLNRFAPLARYLENRIDRPVQVVVSADYGIHIHHVGRGNVDIAYLGPASYVDLVQRYGSQNILARQSVNGSPTFTGKIVTRADSSVTSIRNLHGKRMAFGDPVSTMSHLVPRYMLLRAGVNDTDLAAHEFLENHDDVALGVLMGAFDAGALKESVAEKYRDQGLVILAETPRVSEHLFVAKSGLSPDMQDALREALLSLHETPGGAQILGRIKSGIDAFVPAVDDDYANLRMIIDTLRRHGVVP